jgi:hypothetical protein
MSGCKAPKSPSREVSGEGACSGSPRGSERVPRIPKDEGNESRWAFQPVRGSRVPAVRSADE